MNVGLNKRTQITVRETSVVYRSLEPITITVESGPCRVVEYITDAQALELVDALHGVIDELRLARFHEEMEKAKQAARAAVAARVTA